MHSYKPRPRLVRPQRRDVRLVAEQPQPKVAMRSAEEVETAQRRAKQKLIAVYCVFSLFFLTAFATKPHGVEAERVPSTRVHQVDERVFVEVTAAAETDVAALPGEQRTARMSHYWPPLGGVNCAVFRDGQCVSRMASGLRWEDWVGRAAACPVELPFWTLVTLPGGEEFFCLDRGGKIVTTGDGALWIDLLVESAPVPFGTLVPVTVRLPQ
jgi:hypothetical protein